MKKMGLFLITSLSLFILGVGCASDDRKPAGYSRSGREYQEPRAMNHRRLDTETLYRACLRERPEVSCRNRMGR